MKIDLTNNKSNHSLTAFLEMGLPCCGIFLFSSNDTENEPIYRDTEETNQLLTHVRVSKVAIGQNYKHEKRFWEGLPNLQVLFADQLEYCPYLKPKLDESDIPLTFSKLKGVEVKRLRVVYNNQDGTNCVVELVPQGDMPILEHLDLPYYPDVYGNHRNATCLNHLLSFLRDTIEQQKFPNLTAIKFVRVQLSHNRPWNASELEGLHQLCQICETNELFLIHVDAAWFKEVPSALLVHSLGTTLISMRCKNGAELKLIEQMNLIRLEHLLVDSYKPVDTVMKNPAEPRPDWPNLISLTINVQVVVSVACSVKDVKHLFTRFFENDPFPVLKKACVIFPQEVMQKHPAPMASLVGTCSSLKWLEFQGWRGPKKSLLNICKGMERLERIMLYDYEEEVGKNVFFVSKNGDPVLINIKMHSEIFRRFTDPSPDSLLKRLLSRPIRKRLSASLPGPLILLTPLGYGCHIGESFPEFVKKFPSSYYSFKQSLSWEEKMFAHFFRAAAVEHCKMLH